MKKFVIALTLVLTLLICLAAHAEQAQQTEVKLFQEKKLVKSVVFAIGVNKYYVDNKSEGVVMDARPFIQDGRTFVPIRYLSRALGVEDRNILWDDAVKKVKLTAWNYVEMTVGSPALAVKAPGMEMPYLRVIDVSPILKAEEGRTYLPARYVAEALGYEVEWDEATQTVLCWPRGEAKPDVSAVKQVVQRERDLLAGKVPEGYKVTDAGYIVPKPENTKLLIKDPARTEGSGVDLRLVVYLPSSDYAKARLPKEQWRTEEQRIEQLKQVEEILAQKHGREIARAVVEYAGQKKDRDSELPYKTFPLPTGGKITVMSSGQAWYITIDVWRV
ncbi:MAG: copper amine oxidase N-terminal domain-containing protein [Peptococcaceae bacterium]|nr:copper amine oxidase N-terminal domain-containing protein [Peptococcaceae bacterium]